MKPRTISAKRSLGLMLLWTTLVMSLAIPAWGEALKVAQPHERLYQAPDFNSQALGPVPPGASVKVLHKSGSWLQVEYQGKVGWLHRKAFPWSPATQSGPTASPPLSAPPGFGQPAWIPPSGGGAQPWPHTGPLSHPGLIHGKPVKGTMTDEIATGGKAVPPPPQARRKSRPKRPPARVKKTAPLKRRSLPQGKVGPGGALRD